MAVPGAAGIAGVPVDREAILREELSPVFAMLRDADREANDTVARAESDAELRRTRAKQGAQRILDEAREAVPAAREAASSAETSSAESDAAAIRAAAHEEAGRIGRDAAQRIPAVADELVQRVMSAGSPSGAAS
jgi:vacuolar-type H+-ATPase subunit H